MSREDDHLNVRAMQILDDPALPVQNRVPNASQLLRQLAANVKDNPAHLAALLEEITDLRVREAMRVAIAELNA